MVQYWDARSRKLIYRRFETEDDAKLFWAHLNVSRAEGKLDDRDYAKDNPLGFRNQAETWLEYRKREVRSFRHLRSHIHRACDFFGDKSIKEIGYAELEDFLHWLPGHLSSKTRKNIFTTLSAWKTEGDLAG